MTLPAQLHTSASPGCVGRDRDLTRLLATLDSLDRHGTFVAVTGPTGIGKSTFLLEASRRLQERGVTTFVTRCRPGLSSLRPIVELLQGLLVRLCEGGDPGMVSRAEELLATFDGRRDARGQLDRITLFEQLAQLLRDVAEARPIALLVHDIDVADAGTRQAFVYLGRELTSSPELSTRRFRGVIVATAAQLEQVGGDARWADGSELLHIALEGIGKDGVRAYLGSEAVIERVLELTDGVPQRLESLVNSELARRLPSPLTRASAEERRVLELLATFGRPLAAETLGELTELAGDALTNAIANLVRRQIIEKTVGDGALRVAFRRVGDERAVYEALPVGERRKLHATIGYHLQATDDDLESCADHLLRGGVGDDAVRAAERAAERLEIAYCYERAGELYERALEQVASDETRRRLLRALCAIFENSAQLDRAIEIAERLQEAEGTPDSQLKLARLLLRRGDFSAARQRLQELAQQAARFGDQALCAQVHAEQAEALSLDGQRQSARDAAQRGLALCDELEAGGETTLRLALQNTLGKLALDAGDVDEARRLFEENLRRADAAGLVAETARASIQLGMTALSAADYAAAEQHYELGRQLSASVGEHRYLGACLQHLGVLAERRRDYAEAIRCYQLAVGAWKKVGHRSYLAWVGLDLAKLYLDLGGVGRATAMLKLAEKLADAEPPLATRINRELLTGRLAKAACRFAEAKAHLTRAEELAEQNGQLERASRASLELAALAYERDDSLAAAARVDAVLSEDTSTPVRLRALLLRAQIEARGGSKSTARAASIEALELASDLQDDEASWEAHLHLAMVARSEGRESEAQRRLLDAARIETRVRQAVPKDLREAVAEQPLRVALRAALGDAGRASGELPPPRPQRAGEDPAPFPGIVGAHPRIQQVLAQVERVAGTDATVLIRGESGTGKELIADAIHERSRRAGQPLVKVNCGALVESLLLSELFGHERGAFTGATQRKAGRFELANGGTIFLDEIGDISAKTQVALLRVLQERCFERVGGTSSLDVDVRIIFATNRDLEQMVAEGTFREDLYYRLRGVQIELPPLRQRASDVAPLATHFLRRIASERDTEPKGLDASAIELLTRYGWPGNIRELENVLRSVSLFADDRLLGAADFADYPELSEATDADAPREPDAAVSGGSIYTDLRSQGVSLRDFKKQVEAACIREALTESDGNITRAAELLGMKRPRLSQLIKEHGLATR